MQVRLASWRVAAACRTAHSDIFFAANNEGARARRTREQAAKAICATCTVADQCLQYAIASRQCHGVWGGLTAEERRVVDLAKSPRVSGLEELAL